MTWDATLQVFGYCNSIVFEASIYICEGGIGMFFYLQGRISVKDENDIITERLEMVTLAFKPFDQKKISKERTAHETFYKNFAHFPFGL